LLISRTLSGNQKKTSPSTQKIFGWSGAGNKQFFYFAINDDKKI
jgi:hypothetical protein